ncbi:MAG: cupin domain-containing protein [Chloroflexi bacterium]|nr:cupin domain-containing protein [Chloroflexota bacterium]
MDDQKPYSINTDVRFNPLELIDIPGIVAANDEEWFNQTLSKVNDCVVRLGIVRGEFHWHKHDDEDEFFYIVDGKFYIDLEGKTVELNPKQGFMVPKGVVHKTRAPEGAVILMVEGSGVIPTGDE